MLHSTVFMSYAREDRERVLPFYERLEALGFHPWMDLYTLRQGESWETQIRAAVREADFFVHFLSVGSLRKDGYQQQEVALARRAAAEMPRGTIFMLPARLEECSIPTDAPAEYSVPNCADLFTNAGFERMVAAMRSRSLAVATARLFAKWLPWGAGASLALAVFALLLAHFRSAPLIAERLLVSQGLASATALLLFWLIAGWILRRNLWGLAVGLLAGAACWYLLLTRLDPYPLNDLARAFTLKNPSQEWSYGYVPKDGRGFVPFSDLDQTGAFEGYSLVVPGYARIPAVLRGTRVHKEDRLGFSFLTPGIVDMHPGWRGEYATIRWTPHHAGTYRFSGYFLGLDNAPTSTDVHIVDRSEASLFTSNVDTFGVPIEFSFVRKLDTGDFVEFRVGPGSNGEPTNDSTGLVANVSEEK